MQYLGSVLSAYLQTVFSPRASRPRLHVHILIWFFICTLICALGCVSLDVYHSQGCDSSPVYDKYVLSLSLLWLKIEMLSDIDILLSLNKPNSVCVKGFFYICWWNTMIQNKDKKRNKMYHCLYILMCQKPWWQFGWTDLWQCKIPLTFQVLFVISKLILLPFRYLETSCHHFVVS